MVIPVQCESVALRVQIAPGRTVLMWMGYFTCGMIWDWVSGRQPQVGFVLGSTLPGAALAAIAMAVPRRFVYGTWHEVQKRKRALAARRAEPEREFGERRRKGD